MATGPWFVVARTPIFTAVESETGDKLLRSFASMGRWLAAAGGAPVPKSGGGKPQQRREEREKVLGDTGSGTGGKCQSEPEDAGGVVNGQSSCQRWHRG